MYRPGHANLKPTWDEFRQKLLKGTERAKKSAKYPTEEKRRNNGKTRSSITVDTSPAYADTPVQMPLVMCDTDRNPPSTNPRNTRVTERATQLRVLLFNQNARVARRSTNSVVPTLRHDVPASAHASSLCSSTSSTKGKAKGSSAPDGFGTATAGVSATTARAALSGNSGAPTGAPTVPPSAPVSGEASGADATVTALARLRTASVRYSIPKGEGAESRENTNLNGLSRSIARSTSMAPAAPTSTSSIPALARPNENTSDSSTTTVSGPCTIDQPRPVEVPKRGAIDGVDEDVSAALSPINRSTDHPHRSRANKPFAKRLVHDVAQRDRCAAGFIGHLHPDHDTRSKQIEPRQAGRVFHPSFNRLGCIQIDFSHPAGRVSYTPCQSPHTHRSACPHRQCPWRTTNGSAMCLPRKLFPARHLDEGNHRVNYDGTRSIRGPEHR